MIASTAVNDHAGRVGQRPQLVKGARFEALWQTVEERFFGSLCRVVLFHDAHQPIASRQIGRIFQRENSILAVEFGKEGVDGADVLCLAADIAPVATAAAVLRRNLGERVDGVVDVVLQPALGYAAALVGVHTEPVRGVAGIGPEMGITSAAVQMGKKTLGIGWGDHSFLHHVVAHFSLKARKNLYGMQTNMRSYCSITSGFTPIG